MGSGGLVVMDEETCIVDVARFFLSFTRAESCGKCTPCREGIKRMLEILDRISAGEGKMEDLDLLERTALIVKNSALCGLGQTAPNPILSTLRYFRDEYEATFGTSVVRPGGCAQRFSPTRLSRNCAAVALPAPKSARWVLFPARERLCMLSIPTNVLSAVPVPNAARSRPLSVLD